MRNPQQPRYLIKPYTIETLKELLREFSGASTSVLESKLHTHYFDNYFRDLSAKTIIVETEYVDSHYLEDYAAFYSQCFRDYKRFCARLHFFDIEVSEAGFSNFLLRDEPRTITLRALTRAYLGFIVVKPLPETFIGRTCLKTYPDIDVRHFPITRHYAVSLFGIDLYVKTLAFQEQDTAASGCATSALWSAFHGTGPLFHHHIPSPVQITNSATIGAPVPSRTFPNYGLTATQMSQAIRSVGLEPFYLEVNDNYVTKSHLYAYLKGKVPVLMLGRSIDVKKMASPIAPDDCEFHAIAASGFRTTEELSPYGKGLLLRASSIQRIYAHDDQVGPFSRLVLTDQSVEFADSMCKFDSLSSQYGPGGQEGHIFVPMQLLIPLETSIRIPFETILDAVVDFDSVVEQLRLENIFDLPGRLVWDVYLMAINDFKHKMHQDMSVSPALRQKALLCPLPKFVWRATARSAQKNVFDFLFDTTDALQGPLLKDFLFYDEQFGRDLLSSAKRYLASGMNISRTSRKLWERLALGENFQG
jgi:hypothetical protein